MSVTDWIVLAGQGISFTLIIIQVHARDWSEGASESSSGIRTSRLAARRARGTSVELGAVGGVAVEVHVSQLRDLDEHEGSDVGSKPFAKHH